MRLLKALALALAAFMAPLAAALPARAETVLVMAEEEGCMWCARWNAEIGPIYPRTPEGKAVPLRRIDIHAPPDDLRFERRLFYTPTFVLMKDGEELGRIEGYPGEDFFWGLLGMLLAEKGIVVAPPDETG